MTLRNCWNSYHRHLIALDSEYLDAEETRRHSVAMESALATMNGIRETLEVLGYSIRYDGNSIPQVCTNS